MNISIFLSFCAVFLLIKTTKSTQNEKLEIFSLGSGKNFLHFSFKFTEYVDLTKIRFERKNWERSVFEALIEKSKITNFKVHMSNGQLNPFFKQEYNFFFDVPEYGAKIFLNPEADYKSSIHSLSEIFSFERKTILNENHFLMDVVNDKDMDKSFDSINDYFLQRFIFANSPDDFICVETLEKLRYFLGCAGTKGLFALLDLNKIFKSEYLSITGNFRYDPISKETNYGIEINLLIDYDLREAYLDTQNLEICNVYDISQIISFQKKEEIYPIIYDLKEIQSIPFAYIPFIKDTQNMKFLGMKKKILNVSRFFTYPVYSFENEVVYQFSTKEYPAKIIFYEYLPYYFSPKMYKIEGYLNYKKEFVNYTCEIIKNHTNKAFLLKFTIFLPENSYYSLKIPIQKLMKSFENYPHDAARGHPLIGAPIIYYLNNENNFNVEHTQNLLLRIPEPDFSMPFNISTYTFVLLGYFYLMVFKIVTGRNNTHWLRTKKETFLNKIFNFFKKTKVE